MKIFSSFIFCGLLVSLGLTSFASTVETSGKRYSVSCSYHSVIRGEFVVNYGNSDLQATGARVFLHRGFNGKLTSTGQAIEWQWIQDEEMEQLPGTNSWTINVNAQLHSRGGSFYYDSLAFVFLIVYPDGSVKYDNGGSTTMSYYKATFPVAEALKCSSANPEGSDIPYSALPVEVIVR